jgi:pimeloyl-ACP methyl ester carboxylesterase
VILLHSSASSSRQWDRLREAIGNEFEVHAPEMLAHDLGPRPGRFSLVEEARALLPLLTRDGGAHVIGHSYGGAVALKLAAIVPTFVRSVVAYEPVVFRWVMKDTVGAGLVSDTAAVAAKVREAVARGALEEAAPAFIDYWSGAGTWESMDAARREAILPRLASVPRHFEALFSEPMRWADVAALDVPMRFLSGTATVAVARRSDTLLRGWFPEASHEHVADAGHLGPITHAAAVNAAAMAFLREVERSAISSPPSRRSRSPR